MVDAGSLGVFDFLTVFRTCRDLWHQLLEHSRRQTALIADDDYDQLLQLLSCKQRLLERLDAVKRQHPDLQKRWRTHRDAIDPHVRDDCNHLLAETEAILSELQQQEQAVTEQLIDRRDATREALQSLAAGHDAHIAYRDNLAPATHRRLDVNR